MLGIGLLTAISAGIVAFALAWLIERNAHRLGVVASPNERSSHTVPTPSGGGLGIVAGGTIGAAPALLVAPSLSTPVVALSLVVAAIGFLDDRRPLPAVARLAAQLLLAGGMVATLPLATLGANIGLPLPVLLLGLLLVLAAVYWINVFNFMDGIDGIAASQAAFMLLAAVALIAASPAAGSAATLWWFAAVAAATLGFLLLNWPPAIIFMGDAGSTYLGFMIAFAALTTIAAGWLSLWQWLILGALFLADATLTLVRRLLRREPVFKAHRLHAYQHLSRRWGQHRRVTLLAVGINLVWVLPLAWMAGAFASYGPAIAVIAYLPLAVGLLLAGAGAPERAAADS